MSKAILIPIQPKWCELIASSKKTVEVRKTRPKLETPFKVYIYCTLQGSNEFFQSLKNSLGEYEALSKWNRENWGVKKGKVIGEFVCDDITRLVRVGFAGSKFTEYQAVTDTGYLLCDDVFDFACLTKKDVNTYLNGKIGYAWHISNLVIYDKPKELSEFYYKCEKMPCEGCEHLKYQKVNSQEYDWDCEYFNYQIPITRPPQSWCYVEELSE